MNSSDKLRTLWAEHIADTSENSLEYEHASDNLSEWLVDIHDQLMLDDTFIAGLVTGYFADGKAHIAHNRQTLSNSIRSLQTTLEDLQNFTPTTDQGAIYRQRYIKLATRLLQMSMILREQVQGR